MAEEEETSTRASTFTSFKYHISIEFWAKTGKQNFCSDTITLLDAFEVKWRVNIHLHDRIDGNLIKIDHSTIF